MKNKVLPKIGQRAFSLVELLVVIAVIAIIAAIAIPNIANITQQAGIAKDQRNAQNIASVAAAALAAGYAPTAWTAGDADSVIDDLEDGIEVISGGTTMQFSISPLSDTEQANAAGLLVVESLAGDSWRVNYSPAATSGS